MKYGKIFSPFLPALLLVFVMGAFVPQYIERARLCLMYPYQLDGEEGFILNQAISIARGESIYQPIEDYPFLVGNYPPVYPAFMSLISQGGEFSLYQGRLIALVSLLGIMIVLFFACFSLTLNLPVSLLAPLLFLLSYDNYEWMGYCRVDYLAVFFSVAGIGFILGCKRRAPALISATILFFLALYTKHIQFAAPVAVFFWLLLAGEKKNAFKFLIALVLSGAVALVILALASGGEIIRHLILYNANKFDFNAMRFMLIHFWRFNHFLIVLAFVFLCVDVATGINGKHASSGQTKGAHKLVTLYFVVSMLTLIGLAKAGSAPNYFIEPESAMALFITVKSVEFFKRLKPCMIGYKVTLCIVFLVLISAHVVTLNGLKPFLFSPHNPDSTDITKGRQVIRIIRAHPGDVLSEYPLFNIMTNRPVLFQPFIMSTLAGQNIWEPSDFIRDIENKKFSLIITTTEVFEKEFFFRWHPDIIKSIRAYYQPYQRFVRGRGINYFVYTPQPDA